jgi:transposase InsO family protein
MEALTMRNEKAQELARCLLKEIIPWFGIPVSIGSDNGPAFVTEVVQLMAKGLGITWKLHMAYCLQSPGEVECINRSLKLQLGKLCQETHLQWDQLLPVEILRIRSSPTKQTGLSPFDILYGHQSSLIQGIQGDLKEIGNLTLTQQMQALGLTLSKINDWVQDRLPVSLTTPTHLYRPGKGMECPTAKASLERPSCYFFYPNHS